MSSSSDIYQQIFDIDIAQSSGLRAVLEGEAVSDSEGYIVVNESVDTSRPEKLFSKVVIPESKKQSYDLAQALFDNYDLLSSLPDVITAEERGETDKLISYVITTPPMRVAREYITSRSGRTISDGEWYARINEAWFRSFAVGSSPSRSGFEHVFLGEWKAGSNTVGGLHWWYFYNSLSSNVEYKGAKYDASDKASGLSVPEIATMTFTWNVQGRSLNKPIGGFLIGPSVEGLMAMGMVRAAVEASPPSTAVINGIELDLKMFRSDDGRSINTFYPVLRDVILSVSPTPGPPDSTPTDTDGPQPAPSTNGALSGMGGLRIISVMSNPEGVDAGRERVTLLNMSGEETVDLRGWKVRGPNGTALQFGNQSLERGEARTFQIPARGSLQLSNAGGDITLLRSDGGEEQKVTYDRTVARVQNGVLVWDGKKSLVIYGN